VTLPEINAKFGENLPSRSLPSDTGTAFIVGLANRGPTTIPVLVRSLAEYVSHFGPRVSYGTLYDTLDVAFHEGLDHAYVVRNVGPAAVTASKNLVNAGSENTLEVKATSPGEWGNSIKVAVVAGSIETNFKLHVLYEGTLVEASPDLETTEAAVGWAANSAYITLKDLAKGDPKVQEVTLASGADDRASVNSTVITAGLALFTADLGAGQVAVPGNTAEAVQDAILAHCASTLRVPVIDVADTATAATILSDASALRSASGAKQGGAFAPWDIAPGIAPGTTRTVPPCARQLGAIARVDASTGNPNTAAAGETNGRARYVIGLSQTYSAADRESLNGAGVNVSILDGGVPTTFGWRTFANPITTPGWVPLSSARLMMSLAYGAKKVLKRYFFAQLDEQGESVAKAQGAIENEVVKPAFTDRAIFGATEAEACSVEVTEEVSPTDGSVGKLEATLVARPSKFAEVIELTVVETNEAL
jgi:phage tail sheath protein FI